MRIRDPIAANKLRQRSRAMRARGGDPRGGAGRGEKSMVNRCRAYRVVKQLVNIQSTYTMHNVVVCTERAYVPET